jgi:adenine-specific DNA-methyltransferase
MSAKNRGTTQLIMNFYPKEQLPEIRYIDKNISILKKSTDSSDSILIHQRRYLGNKYNALPLIDSVIKQKVKSFSSFCDIFSGTGTVGDYYNKKDISIISNDILYSNYITLTAFLGDEIFNDSLVTEIINYFNGFIEEEENYCSEYFGNRYFSMQNAKKIGSIREEIEDLYRKKEINFREKSIILTSLIYAMDKIANTVGHYDAYIKKEIESKVLRLKKPKIIDSKNSKNRIFNEDSNSLIKKIKGDILYIDPPYNSRQYCDNYHLLENIARWEKPKVKGVANKFDRTHLKSRYNLKEAPVAFDELIRESNFRYILFSYNNMQKKGNSRSNARISDEQIMDTLGQKGKVEVFEQDYKAFTTGKSSREDNKERVFFVEVKR